MRVSSRILYLVLAILVIVAPAVITIFMVTHHIGVSFAQFVPWVNDEVSLWHQALTFGSHGLTGGGYYTLYELPAQASFTHYYAWGPFFPMLQGIFGRIFGWELYSGVIFNMIVLCGAIAFFISVARPTLRQLALTGALLSTFWTLLVYIPTGMQETFQAAVAIALAAMFARLVSEGPALSRSWQWALGSTLLFASLMRGTWVLAFFPYFLLVSNSGWRSYALALAKAALISTAAFAFYNYVSAELPYRFTDQVVDAVAASSGLREKIAAALHLFGDRIALNRQLLQRDMLRFDWLTIGVVMWAQYLLVVVGVAVWLGICATQAYRARQPLHIGQSIPREIAFHLLNLLLMLLLLILLYQVDFRMGVAALLLSLLVMILTRRFWAVLAVIALNLLIIPYFLNTFEVFAQGRFFSDRQYIERFDALISPHVAYQEDAPSGWCNTLLIPMEFFSWPVTVVPKGIGVSMYLTIDNQPLPVKSRYLVLTETGYARISDHQELEQLNLQSNLGPFAGDVGLYLNRDAPCGDEPRADAP